MKIAFFNWRDIKNPFAGGAEVYVHQVMKHLTALGHDVTLFTSTFPGSPEKEIIDGVVHVRYAGKYQIFSNSYFCYNKYIKGKFDLIVESINAMPFFTPLFAKEKVIPFIHQLTRENWYSGICFPIAFFGYHSEDHLLRLYKKLPTVVPSESTRDDLRSLGFQNISVIKGAADVLPHKDSKETNPTLLYLGRLTSSKQVDHVLQTFRNVLNDIPNAKLWIAGRGPEESKLKKLAIDLKINDSVKFFGYVDTKKKPELLSRAHIMLFPAVREGWGLVVLEANACGTPVIGYNTYGLRDSIIDGVNGFLVDNVKSMSAKAIELLSDTNKINSLCESSLEHSKKFNWEKTTDEFRSLFERVIAK
ncbi:glycosyltransferase family 4 protein [Candidatus Micrarchaeota archaeon]|nr:glycosyltransferase family 4 protein [Candidatus Micrarchaeota archaeon]MBU1681223.1 glycosyltransferase family 4 protein [Candidatus Micrarchaeota archaeon]